MTNIPESLSAALMMLSLPAVKCRALRSRLERWSAILMRLMLMTSRSMLSVHESSAGSKPLGGVEELERFGVEVC